MKKIRMIIPLFLSYLSLILSMIFLYATSKEDNGKIAFQNSAILAVWICFGIFLLSIIITIVFSIISYFRKRKTYPEQKEEISKLLISFSYQIQEYTPYFLLSAYRNRKDLLLLGFHSFFLPLYSLILYFQKGIEKRLFYFYLIFLFGIFLFLLFLLFLLLIPLAEKRKKKELSYETEIYSDKLIIREGDKERILYDSTFSFGKECKRYLLFFTRDGEGFLLPKEKMEDTSRERLSRLIRNLKEERITTTKKH